jgi:hypothetical protein
MKYIAYLFCSAIFFFGIYYIVPEYLIISAAVWLIVSAASTVYLYFVDSSKQGAFNPSTEKTLDSSALNNANTYHFEKLEGCPTTTEDTKLLAEASRLTEHKLPKQAAFVDSSKQGAFNPSTEKTLDSSALDDANTYHFEKLERCPTTTEDTKLRAEASRLTGHKLPKQAANATITVSTLSGIGKWIISATLLPKADRIRNLLKRYPNKDFIFIDDDKYNITTCPSSTNIQALLYNKDNIYTDLKVSENTILLLDFDQTLTITHTFKSTQLGRYDRKQEYNFDFNQNIINFLKKFPGDVIILTDHNNHDFVVSQIKKAIKQCNSEYNQEQELNRDNKTKSHNHEPLNY